VNAIGNVVDLKTRVLCSRCSEAVLYRKTRISLSTLGVGVVVIVVVIDSYTFLLFLKQWVAVNDVRVPIVLHILKRTDIKGGELTFSSAKSDINANA
jgi:hypothetical protein